MAPRSATGTISTQMSGCSLQPVDAEWVQNFEAGWGGIMASCFHLDGGGGCTSADVISLDPYVDLTVNWHDTDSYPTTVENQLWATVPGR
ncbi:MAG TPA: hypothetical protein VIH90_07475 [Candidatus Saccharimonadales bacterium]